jgi:hypothetical protein
MHLGGQWFSLPLVVVPGVPPNTTEFHIDRDDEVERQRLFQARQPVIAPVPYRCPLEQLRYCHKGNRQTIALEQRCVSRSTGIAFEQERDNIGVQQDCTQAFLSRSAWRRTAINWLKSSADSSGQKSTTSV